MGHLLNSWIWWSLWIPSKSEYSVFLWKYAPWSQACVYVATLSWWPGVSWAPWARNKSLVSSPEPPKLLQSYQPGLHPGSSPKQQNFATALRSLVLAASCSISTSVTTLMGHLLTPMSQNKNKILAIFLGQQCLKLDGWLSPLQTDLIHLLLQQFLWCVVGDSIQLPSTSNTFLQYSRTHQGTLLLTS